MPVASEAQGRITTQAQILARLDSLKLPTNGQLHAFGLLPETWNTVVEGVKLGVRGGLALRQAIDQAITGLKQRFPDIDDERVRIGLGASFADPVVLPDDQSWLKGNTANHERAKQIGRELLQGKQVINRETDWPIRFSQDGIQHTLYDARMADHFQSITGLKELMANGKLVNTEPDKRNRLDIKAIHTFASNLHVGNREYAVKIRVRELNDGRKFYDHELLEKKPADLSDSPSTVKGEQDEPSAGQTKDNTKQSDVKPAEEQSERPAEFAASPLPGPSSSVSAPSPDYSDHPIQNSDSTSQKQATPDKDNVNFTPFTGFSQLPVGQKGGSFASGENRSVSSDRVGVTKSSGKRYTENDIRAAMSRLASRGVKASGDVQVNIDPNQVIAIAQAMKSKVFQNQRMTSPVIIDSKTGAIIAGNHRMIAAEMAGFKLHVHKVPASVPTVPLTSMPLKSGRINPPIINPSSS